MLGAFGLFLATSLAGRVWCGFTCPQTVWTDLFMWVERAIEGDRGARIRLDKAPLTAREGGPQGAQARRLAADRGRDRRRLDHVLQRRADGGPAILTGDASLAVYFFFGLFTATTYLLAGFAREQVCTYMCPWPRFQAALLDQDSLRRHLPEVARRAARAAQEDRRLGRAAATASPATSASRSARLGIDIRDGLQLECIGCGLCIDACNDVMAKIGRPPELITLDTERNQELRAAGCAAGAPLRAAAHADLRGDLLVLVGGGMLIGLSARAAVDINVLHDRNPLFVTLSDGGIRNGYTSRS